jgi:hypothetical protein
MLKSVNLIAVGLVACLALTACDKQVSTADATTAPVKKKSMARQAQMYAGQEQVQSIESGTVSASPAGGVILNAKATTPTAGWTQVGFLPRIYPATPPGGIYEVDVVGQKPASPAAQVLTPVEAKGEWDKYTDGRVKGVTFISKTNEVTVMLAPKAAD